MLLFGIAEVAVSRFAVLETGIKSLLICDMTISSLIAMIRTWQARLAQVQDPMKRKLIDNAIANEGTPTDCIRIHLEKNDEGDINSRILDKADIVPIIFPAWKDVPYRRLIKSTGTSYTLTSLVNAAADENKESYSIIAPHSAYLLNDDLIIRVMIDPDILDPILICLQVQEPLGTFGGSMLIMSKYNTSLYNESLSEDLLSVIAEMAKRRLHIGF